MNNNEVEYDVFPHVQWTFAIASYQFLLAGFYVAQTIPMFAHLREKN